MQNNVEDINMPAAYVINKIVSRTYTQNEYAFHLLKTIEHAAVELKKLPEEAFQEWNSYLSDLAESMTILNKEHGAWPIS